MTDNRVLSTLSNSTIAGKNFLINGGFDIWQRGTSYSGTPTANTVFYYTADRWFHAVGTGSFSATFERVTSENSDSTYGIKFGRNSGAGNNSAPSIIGQVIESANAKRLAGKTVTLSFYAKTLSSFGNSMQVYLVSGTGTDQSAQTIFGAGWTGGTTIFAPGQTISTSMTKYTFTGTVPANANQLFVMFSFYVTPATAGANEYVQMENIQLEVGPTATSFSRAAGTIQQELAACQRYYYKSYPQSVTPGTGVHYTGAQTATAYPSPNPTGALWVPARYPVTMRGTPAITIYHQDGTVSAVYDVYSGGKINISSVDFISESGFWRVSASTNVFTPNYPYYFHYTASAEL